MLYSFYNWILMKTDEGGGGEIKIPDYLNENQVLIIG